jgi:CubicO group peptidase (beta-lactamase class C family)
MKNTISRKIAKIAASPVLIGVLASCSIAPTDVARTENVGTPKLANTTMTSLLDPAASQTLDRELTAIMDTPGKELSSIAAVAIRDGRIVYSHAIGNAFIDSSDPAKHRKASTETMYRIASISKLVVALGVVKLVDEGKLDVDRDVGEYLGYVFRNPNFPNEKITLRMLLSHTSSLRDSAGYNFPESVNLREVVTPGGSRYQNGAAWAKDRAPGGYFNYCNFNFGVIANVMERATNERFDRLMQRLIFAPMGITATFDPASLSASDRTRIATLYRKRSEVNGKEVWNAAGPWIPQVDDFSKEPPKPRGSDAYVVGTNGSLYGPQGGARISANDLAKLMLMLMNGGEYEGRRVLSKRAVELLLSEQWRYSKGAFDGKGNRAEDDEGEGGLFNAWALGPQIFLDVSGKARGDRIAEGGGFAGIGHLGNAYGLTSAFVFDPKTKDGMIFLVGGTAAEPEKDKGEYSAFYRYEERILTALHRGALQRR